MYVHQKVTHTRDMVLEHGKKHALTTHQAQLQKQEAQASRHGMTPNRMHKDWIPCAAENIRCLGS